MRSNTSKLCAWFLVLLLPMMLLACGGGGGSSSGDGTPPPAATSLQVASKVSVVDAKLSGSVAGAAPLKLGWAGILKALSRAPGATSAYYLDKTQVWVNERSVESLDNVNNILCMVGQTKYDAMLNQGAYVALVDQNLCGGSKSNASTAGQDSQNQSSSATMPDYMKFVLNSSRVDDNHDEIVNAWVHEKNGPGDQPGLIFAHIVISEGTSATNPYGIFTMNFAGYPLDSSGQMIGYPNTPNFRGTLRAVRSVPSDPASKVLLQFAQDENRQDGWCGTMTSARSITLDKVAGAGHVKDVRTGTLNLSNPECNGTTEFGIAYNDTDFFRKDISAGTPSVCLSRTSFDESSWNYGLYDANGARLNRNSGFPISFTQGGIQHQGWIGYWGLWSDGTVTLNSGDTVNKVDYNNGAQTLAQFTVFKSGGKLKKHTKKLLTLNDIENIPLAYNEYSGGTNTNYQVVWDGTNFIKTSYMPQNCSNNCYWTDITPQPIDLTQLQWGNLNFWSQSLGGQAQVQLVSCSTPTCGMNGCVTSCSLPAPTAQSVIFYAENIVYPTDTGIPATLACYDNCPNASTAAGVDLNVNNGYVYGMMSGPTSTETDYTFNSTTMTLMLGSNPAVLTTTNQMQQWGITSGALFEPVSANLALLDCNWDGDNNPLTNPQICGWKAWSALDSFYTWETGPNSWNQFIAIKDSNGFVKFDPPMQVKYIGLGGANGNLGTTYMLDYSGFGQLNGIPGKCVNMDNGSDADCSQSANSQSIRWVPQFIIPPTTTVTATDPADNSSTTCYVKPLQVEQRMKADTTPGACSFAPADFSAYTLPSITDPGMWNDPATANGTEPNVTAAPAVIGGVVQ